MADSCWVGEGKPFCSQGLHTSNVRKTGGEKFGVNPEHPATQSEN
jgi:hypothetical protein